MTGQRRFGSVLLEFHASIPTPSPLEGEGRGEGEDRETRPSTFPACSRLSLWIPAFAGMTKEGQE